MKCEACDFYVGNNHCWVNSKAVVPCPEKPCERFKFDSLIGECVAQERERCAKICEEFANDYTKQLRAANECNHRDNAFKYAICIEAARVLAHKIRGEKC